MKFPKIAALVPQGEHFDESAVNEGVWVSQNHLQGIETGLTVSEKSAADAVASLETANGTIATLTEQLTASAKNVETITAEKVNAETRIEEMKGEAELAKKIADARITELQAEVVALGKNPSGTGTTIVTKKDEKPAEAKTGKLSLLDPEHPVNQYAAAQIAAKNKAKP